MSTLFPLLCRLALGAVFIWMGWTKASAPVNFLKLIREYQMVPADMPWLLNGIAAVLPWFEIFCGVLLVLGLLRRGTALIVLIMLVGFSLVIWQRAYGIASTDGLALCAVSFDCGCGAGVVNSCYKLGENGGLMALALITLLSQPRR